MARSNMQPTVLCDVVTVYHRPPNSNATRPELTGLTVRQACRALRAVTWGDIETTGLVELSDGSTLEVELTPAGGGGYLMASQRIVRTWPDRHGWAGRRRIYRMEG